MFAMIYSQPVLVQPFVIAVEKRQWTMVTALALGAVVALSKQGWVSAWVAEKLNTPLKTQLYALGLAMAASFSVNGIAGKDLKTCLEDTANIVILAVFTHQFVIKGLFKGNELVPPTKTVAEKRAVDAQLRATLASIPPGPPPSVNDIAVKDVTITEKKDKT